MASQTARSFSLLIAASGWLVALLLLAGSALAQSPTTSPLYVACVTTTPSTTPLPSSTLPPTMTIASPSPTLNGLFQTATALAIYSATPFPTPTIDTFTPTPLPPVGARYQVVSASGMNVRSDASTGSSTIGYLRYGDVVYIGEHRRVGNIVWGAVLGPTIQWVAIVYDSTPNYSGDETIYLKAIQ